MSIIKILLVSLAAAFSENLIFSKYLGTELLLDETKNVKSALSSGLAITLLTTLTSFFTCLVETLLLKPFSIEYMRTPAFVLVMALVFGLALVFRKKSGKASYVFSSTAVLGTALMVSANGLNIIGAIIYGAFAGVGYTVSMFLFAEIRARLEYSEVPKFFEGLPILLITAGLIALVFTGFYGMKFI